MKIKKKIKKFVDYVLSTKDKGLLGHEFNPKFTRKLRAYAFESDQPLGNGKYNNNLIQITEWSSGEGFDISMSDNKDDRLFSLHHNEIELLLAGLNKMGYFNFKKDELRDDN